MCERKLIVGDVKITNDVDEHGAIHMQISVESGNSDVAIDTMLLAILQICCSAEYSVKDVITRTAFRMSELSEVVVINSGGMVRA